MPSTQQTAIGDGNVQVAGDHNIITVRQTVIEKVVSILQGENETTEQRNRRIMLNHVDNFWVKGILEKSLYGAALLELGIKEDPDALKYPWAIKREANTEALPAGTSMLEIFQKIGMGRSLLILGAPGSGKTTMLLELTRQLIQHARDDVTEPIPVVFNLSSWTEKFTFAEWLTQELNVIYTVPKKLAPAWVFENKILLLLDGLDEVGEVSRDKCVDAINRFRLENGFTGMAVCSRSQDYRDLKTRLTLDGAIEIQSLTLSQAEQYFRRLGAQMKGVLQVLKKDTALREMAATPLFLSVMTLAYNNTQSKDILISRNLDIQRKHLFDTYINRMFERPERTRAERARKQDVIHWLSWIAKRMTDHNAVPLLIEDIQPKWLEKKQFWWYERILDTSTILSLGLLGGLLGGILFAYNDLRSWLQLAVMIGLIYGSVLGLVVVLARDFFYLEQSQNQTEMGSGRFSVLKRFSDQSRSKKVKPASIWDYIPKREEISISLVLSLVFGLIGGLYIWSIFWLYISRLIEPALSISALLSRWWQVYGLGMGVWSGYWGFETALDIWRAVKYKQALPLWQSFSQVESDLQDAVKKLGSFRVAWDWGKGRKGMMYGLRGGLAFGLTYALILFVFTGLTVALKLVLVSMGIGGVLGGLFSQAVTDKAYMPVERKITLGAAIRLNWRITEQDYYLMAVVFTLIFRLIFGLSYGLVIGLSIGFISALRIENRPIDQTTYPGQKINFSISSIFVAYLAIGLLGVITFTVSRISGASNDIIGPLLFFMVIAASIVWFILGSSAIFRHYWLRLILTKNNFIPWNIIPFLNQCVDLIFLRRVGGGYIFVHRLLMEHFAAMYTGDEKTK